MKKALIAAVAALSATAWAAAPAYAQRNDDRGRHERNNDNGGQRGDRGGDRGERGGDRGDRGGDNRGRGEWRGNQNQSPPQSAPAPRTPDNPALLGGNNGGDRRGQWNGERGQRGDGQRGEARREWQGNRGEGARAQQNNPGATDWANRQRDGRDDGQRDGRRGEWNGDRGGRNPPVVADNDNRGPRGDGRPGQWNGDRGDRRGNPPVADNRSPRGDGRPGDGRDWNRDGRDGRGDRDWNNNDRNRDWGRDDRGRDRDNSRDHNRRRDFAYNDWGRDGRRDDNRYRQYRHTHRDFDRPRYNDWRHVRHGYYFDRGYTIIVHNYFGWNYNWWGYDGWRRPYRPWRVGYYLPDHIWWEPVPYDLYYRLPPAPYGCRYVMVDRDILLIAVSTGIILDALMYY